MYRGRSIPIDLATVGCLQGDDNHALVPSTAAIGGSARTHRLLCALIGSRDQLALKSDVKTLLFPSQSYDLKVAVCCPAATELV